MEGDSIHMGCSFLVVKEGIMTLSGTAVTRHNNNNNNNNNNNKCSVGHCRHDMCIGHWKLCLYWLLCCERLWHSDSKQRLCLVCATSRSAPFAIWFGTHWLAPLYQAAVRRLPAPCEDALMAAEVQRCEYNWDCEMTASRDRQTDRQTDRQAERPCQRSGRRSNLPVIHRECRSNHVGFMVDRVWLWWDFFPVFQFFPWQYHCTILQ